MSRFDIELQLEVPVEQPIIDVVLGAAEQTLIHEQAETSGGMTILLTTDEKIRSLNRDFMDVDDSTDVLSFPFGKALPGSNPYLGDVAISVPTGRRQADAAGHSLAEELQLLTVHAVLHLLGYDHGDPSEKGRMWSAQRVILEDLGAEAAMGPILE
jgi:probable rRNA maturation factor